ncbi:MAG: hypothetical protein ACREV6_05915 [Clostridium sp.]|uniref:hypothetical protein n=1 Tax=Clostridium sp. TaxID=1506 RepID=UPI003D6D9723
MMEYSIKIQLDNNDEDEILFDDKSEYYPQKYDSVKIGSKTIEINFKRQGKKNLENLIRNNNSTVTEQITKSLCYLYALIGRKVVIENIYICRIENGEIVEEYTFSEINQPFSRELPDRLRFNHNVLKELFSYGEKSKMLIIAFVSYFKALNENLHGERFNELWKSFNCLYTGISGKEQEMDKLIFIRWFLERNLSYFSSSLNLIDSHDKDSIRQLSIAKMILNNFEDEAKTQAFHDFIIRFEDYRINEVFKDVLVIRRKFLVNKGLLVNVENHISSKIALKKKNNLELLCFYILKYSYFVRNKYFHAEKLDSSFYLVKTAEVGNIEFINNIFEQFLHDLLSCNMHY